ALLLRQPHLFARPAGPGRLLVGGWWSHAPPEVKKPKGATDKGNYVITLDEKALRAKAGDALAAAAPRPAPRGAPRSAAGRVKPGAAPAWKVPAPSALSAGVADPRTKLTGWPHAWNASTAVHVRVVFDIKTGRQSVVREVTDLKTGKASSTEL